MTALIESHAVPVMMLSSVTPAGHIDEGSGWTGANGGAGSMSGAPSPSAMCGGIGSAR